MREFDHKMGSSLAGSAFTVFTGDPFLDPGEVFFTPPPLAEGDTDWRLTAATGAATDWRLPAATGAVVDWRLMAVAGAAAGGCDSSIASDIVGTGPTTRSATYSPTASNSRLGDAMIDFSAASIWKAFKKQRSHVRCVTTSTRLSCLCVLPGVWPGGS